MILLGTAAFLLMLLGDVNDALWHRSALRLCFPVGLILLAAATAARLSLEAFDTAWCAVAAAFLLLLLYALFGSFSVKDAYVSQECGRRVYDKGFYALCRHPGVVWMAGLLVCLWLAGGLRLFSAVVYTLLDVDRGVPEVLNSCYDVRVLLDSTSKMMDGKKLTDIKLPFLAGLVEKATMKKISGTVIEELLARYHLI